jgi:hypothetical protein
MKAVRSGKPLSPFADLFREGNQNRIHPLTMNLALCGLVPTMNLALC